MIRARKRAIAASLPDCREKARGLSCKRHAVHWLSGAPQEALELIETTTRMAGRVGLGDGSSTSRCCSSRRAFVWAPAMSGGIADIEVALAQTLEHGLTFEAGRAYVNLEFLLGGPRRCASRRGVREAWPRGWPTASGFRRSSFPDGWSSPRGRFDEGRWAEALDVVETYFATDPSPYYQDVVARLVRGMIRQAQGISEQGREDIAWAVSRSREMRDPQALFPGARVRGLTWQRATAASTRPAP